MEHIQPTLPGIEGDEVKIRPDGEASRFARSAVVVLSGLQHLDGFPVLVEVSEFEILGDRLRPLEAEGIEGE
ncbi:MAG TPA: hypothetical protein VHD84_01510 [Candidatus Saccharimonadales bacterium]|nr:hypothetical protein [Candidatus Saccharimonadales bacterium]